MVTSSATDPMMFARHVEEPSTASKAEAAAAFVDSGGQLAGIGKREDARAILEGKAGTLVSL
jgi:carbamate kinase